MVILSDGNARAEQREPHTRAVLVTGGGGGLGGAICRAFAREGYCVAVHHALDEPNAAAVAQSIRDAGGWAVCLGGDFGETGAAQSLFEAVDQQVGPIDALVNNAAWDPGARGIDATDEAFIDRLLAINVRAPLMLTRAAAMRWMQAGRPGAVVNVGSIQATHSLAGHSAYAASKGALDAMTRQLAVELGPHGIRVNAVAPGFIEVPRTVHGRANYDRDAIGRRIPLGRVGLPDDVAGVVTFLCGDAARYINGEVITIDGGSIRQLPTHDHRQPEKATAPCSNSVASSPSWPPRLRPTAAWTGKDSTNSSTPLPRADATR